MIDSCFSRIKRQPTIAYEGEEDSSVAGLVAAGFGIAIVPKIPLLDTMDVCVRPIISPEIERYIYLVLKKEKYLAIIFADENCNANWFCYYFNIYYIIWNSKNSFSAN